MTWTTRDSTLVLASLIVGAVAGAFTWSSIKGEPLPTDNGQPPAAEKPDDLVSDLRGEIASLKKRNTELIDLGSQRREMAEVELTNNPKAEPKPDEAKVAEIVALFADEDLGDALADIDWQTMGVNLNEMLPMIAKLAEAIANGDDIPLDVAGEIQKRNGDLIVIAKAIMDASVPGAGINGSFSHPSVVSNQIGAALQAAGLSLNKEQRQSMEQIRATYAARDKTLRQFAGTRDLELQNLLEEVDYKHEFYEKAQSILSEDQRAVLSSDAIRGRAHLDIFDTGIVLAQYAKPIRVKDAADLAAKWSNRIRFEKPLDDTSKKALDKILTSYAKGFPASFWESKPDSLDKKGMMKSSRIRDALRRQTVMMRQIMKTVPMSEADFANLKKAMFVLVPYPR